MTYMYFNTHIIIFLIFSWVLCACRYLTCDEHCVLRHISTPQLSLKVNILTKLFNIKCLHHLLLEFLGSCVNKYLWTHSVLVQTKRIWNMAQTLNKNVHGGHIVNSALLCSSHTSYVHTFTRYQQWENIDKRFLSIESHICNECVQRRRPLRSQRYIDLCVCVLVYRAFVGDLACLQQWIISQ